MTRRPPLYHMHSSVFKEHFAKTERPTGVICAGGALVLPSERMAGRYFSRRIVLSCADVRSCFPTSFNVTGLTGISPRMKASRAYTSPLAAVDAALPIRAICARLSRGNEVEVMQVT